MSSQNDTIVDTSTLTHDDLLDAYEKLAKNYKSAKSQLDEATQKLYTQIQQRKVFENSLSDLQSELDQINSVHAQNLKESEKKVDELKEKNSELMMEKRLLEDQIDENGNLIKNLKNEVDEYKVLLLEKTVKPRISDAHMKNLEAENEELRKRNNEYEIQLTDMMQSLSECNVRIIDYKEKIECLEENIESKKNELEEKVEMIDQMQEKIHVLQSELDSMNQKTVVIDGDRKGNSLFAEVDDQRQKMKQMLVSERNEYIQMKKAVNAKEFQIRQLKRENINIKNEINACSELLHRGENLVIKNLNQYVARLENEKKNLENELKEMEYRMIDIATKQKLAWVSTIVTTSSKEVREIKDKEFGLMRESSSAYTMYSKVSNDLARTKLEIVKYKTLLAQIVIDFKLKINPQDYASIGLSDNTLEGLKYEHFEDTEHIEETVDESETLHNESKMADDNFGSSVASDTPNSEISKNEETAKPVESVPSPPPKILQERTVKISNEVETKTVDNTQSTEESRLNRKRPLFIVKRIVIPSKTAKKENI